MRKQHIAKCVTSVLASLGVVSVAYGHGDLGETTVIASRGDQQLDSVISSVFSEDSSYFTNEGIHNLSNALDIIPGVTTGKTAGQRGSTRGLLIRGMRTNDVQIRVDGVRINNRSFALNSFLGTAGSGGFERIELIKGAQSSLYGGGAVAGVVSLTSYAGGENQSEFFTEVGSFDTFRTHLRHSGSVGSLKYLVQGGTEFTSNDTYDDNSETGVFDNDYKSNFGNLRVAYDFSDDLEVGFTYRGYNSTFENGGGITDTKLDIATLYSNYQITSNWTSSLTVSYLGSDLGFSSPTFNSNTQFHQYGIALENTYKVRDDSLINFGIEYEKSRYDDGTTLARDAYRAAYANWNHQYDDKLSFAIGARYENYNSFENHASWNAGLKYQASKKLAVRASGGSAFTPPTLPDLFAPVGSFTVGNPNLDPETSQSWEVAIDYEINDDTSLTVAYFENSVENAIGTVSSTRVNTSGRSIANGVELGLSGKIGDDWSYRLAYTHLDNQLTGAADQTASANVTYQASTVWNVGVSAIYEGDTDFNFSAPIGGYTKVDLFSNYKINDNVTLQARIENLGDAEYLYFDNAFSGETPASRIAGYLGVKVNW